ncbi:unnamed protein product, partial [Pedinophyceae sp. YPF-701]
MSGGNEQEMAPAGSPKGRTAAAVANPDAQDRHPPPGAKLDAARLPQTLQSLNATEANRNTTGGGTGTVQPLVGERLMSGRTGPTSVNDRSQQGPRLAAGRQAVQGGAGAGLGSAGFLEPPQRGDGALKGGPAAPSLPGAVPRRAASTPLGSDVGHGHANVHAIAQGGPKQPAHTAQVQHAQHHAPAPQAKTATPGASLGQAHLRSPTSAQTYPGRGPPYHEQALAAAAATAAAAAQLQSGAGAPQGAGAGGSEAANAAQALSAVLNAECQVTPQQAAVLFNLLRGTSIALNLLASMDNRQAGSPGDTPTPPGSGGSGGPGSAPPQQQQAIAALRGLARQAWPLAASALPRSATPGTGTGTGTGTGPTTAGGVAGSTPGPAATGFGPFSPVQLAAALAFARELQLQGTPLPGVPGPVAQQQSPEGLARQLRAFIMFVSQRAPQLLAHETAQQAANAVGQQGQGRPGAGQQPSVQGPWAAGDRIAVQPSNQAAIGGTSHGGPNTGTRTGTQSTPQGPRGGHQTPTAATGGPTVQGRAALRQKQGNAGQGARPAVPQHRALGAGGAPAMAGGQAAQAAGSPAGTTSTTTGTTTTATSAGSRSGAGGGSRRLPATSGTPGTPHGGLAARGAAAQPGAPPPERRRERRRGRGRPGRGRAVPAPPRPPATRGADSAAVGAPPHRGAAAPPD